MQIKRRITWFTLSLAASAFLAACTQATASKNETQTEANNQAPAAVKVEEVTTTVEEETANPAAADTQAQNDEDTQATANLAAEAPATETDATTEKVLLAGTNITQHSVPLEEVQFDTFNGSFVRLSDATEAIVLQLRDAIPPIEEPKYTDVAAADEWLRPDDIVIGYVDGDEALAYPNRIMNYHEIINEEVNGRPVLISFCPLCNSGIVYDRRLNGQVLRFGNTSALHNSDMVMYDRQTFSYWFQVGGDAIVGDLTGQRLEVLPTRFMRWEEWRQAYPKSKVLSRDTGFSRPYDRDPFTALPQYLNGGTFPFPVGDAAKNPALPAGEKVMGLFINEEARAYPMVVLAGSVVNDELGGTAVAVVVDEAETGVIFSRQVGHQTLTLEWNGDNLVDTETGSQWALSGEAISGPLEGEQLEILAARFSFWFAFVAAFPEATAYQP